MHDFISSPGVFHPNVYLYFFFFLVSLPSGVPFIRGLVVFRGVWMGYDIPLCSEAGSFLLCIVLFWDWGYYSAGERVLAAMKDIQCWF